MSDREEMKKVNQLPEFTLKNVLLDIVNGIQSLLFDPELKGAVLPILWVLEMLGTKIIRLSIPYTEIDYKAYMEQIDIIKSGELNYDNIYGGTGPLVYPAGHVWIYTGMNWLTEGMKEIGRGQWLFQYLYLINQALVFLIYSHLDLQPWALYLLVLSKRIHSIYVLRLFNDCFTTLLSVLMALSLLYASKWKKSRPILSKYLTNLVAPLFFGLAISVKMNALLYFPAFLLVTYFLNEEVLLAEVAPLSVIGLVQVGVAYKFLFNGPVIRDAYLAGAFNFERKFLYEWTVNWKCFTEEFFLSHVFHERLLVGHITTLLFFLVTKWATCSVTGKSFIGLILDGLKFYKPTLQANNIINDPELGPRYVISTLAGCNFIGVLFARSLHYQFLAWYCWTLPFLMYHSSFNFLVVIALYIAHEVCWNVYPSTFWSSCLLLYVNILTLLAYWKNSKVYSRTLVLTEDKKEK